MLDMRKSFINRLSCVWQNENAIPTFMLSLACLYWFSKCGKSLSLDETITYWVVKDGFNDTIYRTFHYQGAGLVHYIIVWVFVQIGGANEIVLRLPSILACVLLCVVLYRFSCKIFDKESAFLGVVVLLCLDGTFTYAVLARSYALALLLSVGSTYALYLWTESTERRFKFFYIFLSSLMVYTHCIFSVIFLVHLLYLYYHAKLFKNNRKLEIHTIVEVYLLIAIFSSPVIYHAYHTAGMKNILSFAAMPTILDLIQSWAKPSLVLSLITSILCVLIVNKNIYLKRLEIKSDLLIFLISWYLLSSLIVFLYSLLSGVSIFVPRYYSWGLPALSLLLGKGLSLIEPIRSRHILLTIFVGLTLIYGGLKSPFNEDWSAAIAYAKMKTDGSNIPVVAYTGIVESRDTSWVINPDRKKYLLSPFAIYRLGTDPILLPATFDQPGASDYLEKTVFPELIKVNQFYLILRMTYIIINGSAVTSDDYLIQQMLLSGFNPKLVESFGHVKIISFKKTEILNL